MWNMMNYILHEKIVKIGPFPAKDFVDSFLRCFCVLQNFAEDNFYPYL